jgi:hypothetical protein
MRWADPYPPRPCAGGDGFFSKRQSRTNARNYTISLVSSAVPKPNLRLVGGGDTGAVAETPRLSPSSRLELFPTLGALCSSYRCSSIPSFSAEFDLLALVEPKSSVTLIVSPGIEDPNFSAPFSSSSISSPKRTLSASNLGGTFSSPPRHPFDAISSSFVRPAVVIRICRNPPSIAVASLRCSARSPIMVAVTLNRRHRPYGRTKLIRFVNLYALKLRSSVPATVARQVLSESAANVRLARTALTRSSIMVRLYGSII